MNIHPPPRTLGSVTSLSFASTFKPPPSSSRLKSTSAGSRSRSTSSTYAKSLCEQRMPHFSQSKVLELSQTSAHELLVHQGERKRLKLELKQLQDQKLKLETELRKIKVENDYIAEKAIDFEIKTRKIFAENKVIRIQLQAAQLERETIEEQQAKLNQKEDDLSNRIKSQIEQIDVKKKLHSTYQRDVISEAHTKSVASSGARHAKILRLMANDRVAEARRRQIVLDNIVSRTISDINTKRQAAVSAVAPYTCRSVLDSI